MTFCYVSGEGTDSSEQGRMRWARVKGKTENELLRLPFKAAYMLRPGVYSTAQGCEIQDAAVSRGLCRPRMAVSRPACAVATLHDDHRCVGTGDDSGGRNGDAKRVLSTADINRIGGSGDMSLVHVLSDGHEEAKLRRHAEGAFYRGTCADDRRSDRAVHEKLVVLAVSPRHRRPGGRRGADDLGPRNLWTAQLSCRGQSNCRRTGRRWSVPFHPAPDLYGDLSLLLGRCAGAPLENKCASWPLRVCRSDHPHALRRTARRDDVSGISRLRRYDEADGSFPFLNPWTATAPIAHEYVSRDCFAARQTLRSSKQRV